MTHPDNIEIKQQQHDNWSSIAEGWRRRDAMLSKGAAPVSQRMLELVNLASGSHLLDIASGTGEPAIPAARLVGATGRVVGTDLSDEMLAVARDKASENKLNNIEFHCMDAELLDFAPASFDAVTLRWGLMFMPEPEACLAAAYKALKPDGRISLACWAAPQKNPFIGILIQTLRRHIDLPTPPPDSPGIFAFADQGRLYSVLEAAGFTDIVVEEMQLDVFEVEDGQAYWETMSDLAAPVMEPVNKMDDSSRSAYINDVIATANEYRQGETLRAQGTTWIASASK